MEPILESAAHSVIGGRKAEVERFVAEASAAGLSPQSILTDGLIAPWRSRARSLSGASSTCPRC